MKSILIVYGTTEGQTRAVAEFIAGALKQRGVEVDLVDSAATNAAQVQPVHAAAILCGSLHQQKYQASLLRFIRDNRAWLAGMPAAFLAVRKRLIMRRIARQQGGDTDTSRDHEYTQWDDLTRFVHGFMAAIPQQDASAQRVGAMG